MRRSVFFVLLVFGVGCSASPGFDSSSRLTPRTTADVPAGATLPPYVSVEETSSRSSTTSTTIPVAALTPDTFTHAGPDPADLAIVNYTLGSADLGSSFKDVFVRPSAETQPCHRSGPTGASVFSASTFESINPPFVVTQELLQFPDASTASTTFAKLTFTWECPPARLGVGYSTEDVSGSIGRQSTAIRFGEAASPTLVVITLVHDFVSILVCPDVSADPSTPQPLDIAKLAVAKIDAAFAASHPSADATDPRGDGNRS